MIDTNQFVSFSAYLSLFLSVTLQLFNSFRLRESFLNAGANYSDKGFETAKGTLIIIIIIINIIIVIIASLPKHTYRVYFFYINVLNFFALGN